MTPARAVVEKPKLRELRAFYHLSDVGTGVKSSQFDFTSQFIARYYKAMNAASTAGWHQFMMLWADERSGLLMEAYAGTAPLRSRVEIQAFVESFPLMKIEVTSVKIAQDELQGASSCVFHLSEPPAGVPSRINVITTFRLNQYGRLVALRMYWHPSEIGGLSKTSQYEITAKRIRAFIDALNSDDETSWSDQAGGVVFEDPVGTLTRTLDKVVEAYQSGLPPFVATLRMIRVGQDELQAAAVIEFAFPDSNLLKPFSIIFTFRFQ
jgi:hypothetical protein